VSWRAISILCVLGALPCAHHASAQAIGFDEAIGAVPRAPDLEAHGRALEARSAGDARISDITQTSRLYFMPGIRVFNAEDRGFEGQVQIGHSFDLGGLAGAQRSAARQERGALSARTRALALSGRSSMSVRSPWRAGAWPMTSQPE
jgi:hypothetical protein